ncbi:MAG: energy-coupling factor transporter ATPase [Bacillota bacterium]
MFKIENLTYFYPDALRPALQQINLSIGEGEFLLVAGGSGSGKSSLVRVLAGLIPEFYGGRIAGETYFRGQRMSKLDGRQVAREVGMVFQDPEKQVVMTGVEAEIAFGLENLGLPPDEMLRRAAEVMGFLGLTSLRGEFTASLSGGQKQKLALAAVLAMQPRALILDEPTSQLDPVAAEELLNLVKRLNEEIGLTVILVEQRLERCYHLADRVVFMTDGRIVQDEKPVKAALWAVEKGFPFVPPVARFFAHLGVSPVPLTVQEGRKLLPTSFTFAGSQPETAAKAAPRPATVVRLKDVWFTYPNGREALRAVNLEVGTGEFVAVVGENGAGKTTLLKIMVGLLKPGRGKVLSGSEETADSMRRDRRPAYLSQNPNDYLLRETVEEELLFTLRNHGLRDDGIVDELLRRLRLDESRRRHPRDLSSGERQRVALASVAVMQPSLLALDEPTRGLDPVLKAELGEFLTGLARSGVSIVLVTHDIEFAAEFASRVVLVFDGRIVSDGAKTRVLGESLFYTTQMGKLFRGYAEGVVTVKDALQRVAPRAKSGRVFHA